MNWSNKINTTPFSKKSLNNDCFRIEWKKNDFISVHEKEEKQMIENYRPKLRQNMVIFDTFFRFLSPKV